MSAFRHAVPANTRASRSDPGRSSRCVPVVGTLRNAPRCDPAIILNKRMPADISSVSVIFWTSAGAIPVYALLTLLLEPAEAWHLTASAAVSVLYLGVAAACFGFVLVVWLTRTYSASRVNVFVFLSPVFGVLIGWVALGETVSVMQALGALAVAAGILIVTSER